MSVIDELKTEADQLGLTYNKNIGEGKLQEKIEQFYEASEAASPAVEVAAVQEKPKPAEVASKVDTKTATRLKREAAARKTRIITIMDNDQRVNTQSTTCVVNCSNEFFDLGTMFFPLNERIEVSQGHINTLVQVKIPLHSRDPKSGLTTVRLRPRYTISYENM
jgi:hypothetical protein